MWRCSFKACFDCCASTHTSHTLQMHQLISWTHRRLSSLLLSLSSNQQSLPGFNKCARPSRHAHTAVTGQLDTLIRGSSMSMPSPSDCSSSETNDGSVNSVSGSTGAGTAGSHAQAKGKKHNATSRAPANLQLALAVAQQQLMKAQQALQQA